MSNELITVTVVGSETTATVTSGAEVVVTIGDVGPVSWSAVTGKPTTFPPQAHSHAIGDVTGLTAALAQKVELDPYGKVLASQLPSYVDDVLEFANAAARPATGETGKIYVTLDNGKIFRWSGSTYIEISAAPGSTDFVPEGTTNLYHTTARAAAAAVDAVTWTTLTGKPTFSAVATSGAYADLTGTPAAYSLPTASATVLGGVKIGSGISIDGDGVISASAGYTLPNATTSTLGGVIVGAGLGVSSGTVSVTYGTTAGTACEGNDARLSDARTPISHAASHQTGGADAINPVIVTPSSLSANQNDYAPGVCDIMRLSSSTAIDLTGLVAGTVDGAMRLLINTNASGGAAITLRHESASSAAANRFRSVTNADVILLADGGSVTLTYSTAISRWRIL
jgi:hypothetical protein